MNGDNIGDALADAFGLRVETWGAYISLVVDPINFNLTLGGQTIGVRDSSFSIAAHLRSKGSFFSSAANMSNANATGLVPNINVPLSAEVILDIPIGDVVVSPM